MRVINDNECSWINDLNPRLNINILKKNEDCEWLIVGAGFTGLSAARKLGQLYPNQKIILADAQLAGEGASGRNSGYLVDTTLNDGFTSKMYIADLFDITLFIYYSNNDLILKFYFIKSLYLFNYTIYITKLPTIILNH